MHIRDLLDEHAFERILGVARILQHAVKIDAKRVRLERATHRECFCHRRRNCPSNEDFGDSFDNRTAAKTVTLPGLPYAAGIDGMSGLAFSRPPLGDFQQLNNAMAVSGRLDFTPTAIIQRDVVDWRTYQQTIEAARPTTINQRLAALTSFFKWAGAQGLVSKNPTEGVKSLSLENLQPKALDKRSERLLCAQFTSPEI